MTEKIVETPLMKQYFEMKKKHPDAILLYRVGDFYETYTTDAIIASEILGITLTKRANGSGKTIEMAGFPHHALDRDSRTTPWTPTFLSWCVPESVWPSASSWRTPS